MYLQESSSGDYCADTEIEVGVLKKVKIVQQATDLTMIGGTTTEFLAMKNSMLNEKYELVPMVLPKVHKKVNLQDILFYYKFLKKERPDIVQIRGAAVDGLNAQIAAKLVPGTKVLLCVHGMFSELVYISRIKRMIHRYIIEPIIFMLSDGISSVYCAGNTRQQLKIAKKKLLPHVYNRIPDYSSYDSEKLRNQIRNELGFSNSEVVGVFCGRFTREKGLSYLLDAFVDMESTWPLGFKCLLLGDGDYLNEFKTVIECKGLSEYVVCVGAKKNVHEYLLASDFMIMPSLHENHSISLLEAISAKLPCVSTDVGGNKEIIHDGIEGVLVPPADSAALKSAIIAMIQNVSLREKFRTNIINTQYSEFTNGAVDDQLDKIYQLMLGNGDLSIK